MEAVNGVSEGDKGAPPPPSPLTGCYLLIVVGEPHCNEHKDIILQRVAKGLLSWDLTDCLVDLGKELAIITEQALEGEEARYGERLIQFASENLVTEILIHPVVSTLAQCVRNLLSSFTRHRHIIHAGYTFANNGSWILQDGTFSSTDFSEAFQEIEVLRVIRAYENGISLDLHCAPEGDWTRLPKEQFAKGCKVRVNPNDVLTAGSPSISSFINYLEPFLVPADLENILESSDVVGNIRFSRPTLYVFPGGQGDAALFGINGFNMLLDGGFSRKACFWDFVRHLDRLDAVLLTRLNNSNVNGISGVLRRKKQNALYPQIGHFFCNIQERKAILSPDGDKDKDPLLINLLDEGQELVSNLRHLSLIPQVCYRDSEPINLYHKVGHGTLDMYVLSPAKDSKEVREFLQKWNNNDQKLFANHRTNKDFIFPLPNLVSICALLVWQPANPEDTITRILFPGSSPQNKIFEGLEKIKSLEFIKHPVCSEKSLAPATIIKAKQSVIDRIMQTEKKIPMDNKKDKVQKPPADVIDSELKNGEVNGDKVAPVKKSDSTESEKSVSKLKKIMENGDKVEKPKPPKARVEPKLKPRSESQPRKIKSADKKPSPTTPKKQVEKTNDEQAKLKLKPSPTATPAKSAKEANNRKVVESKIKAAPPKKEPPKPAAEKKEVKVERKPISRRPKDISKLSGSPSKKVNGVQKPDSISRRGKLDKEGTTDSSTVSTPSAEQDSILKKDISKLTTDEIQNLKAQELADLKEEQEAVKEIEAVFRKGELHTDKPSDFRKIKDLSIDDKLESEEYLIIEKTEIVQDLANETNKEEETQKIARDSEESEKRRKLSQEKDKEEIEEKRTEIQDEVQKIITSATDIVKAKEEVVEASKEVSATSPEDKLHVSTDKNDIEEIKEIAQESQPDEKGSANIESGATTTAPTLPEDERMPLDEIKEDNGDQIIEEKHVKEDTKEKDVPVIQLPSKTFENIAKLPPVVGIRLDKQSHIRDIVKTPDEVADLPVHEEVEFDHFDEYPSATDTKSTPEEVKKNDVEKADKEEKKEGLPAEKQEVVKVDEAKAVVDKAKTGVEVQKDEIEPEVKKKVETSELKAVISEDLNKKELSKSPDEEKDTDEHELEQKKEEIKDVIKTKSPEVEAIEEKKETDKDEKVDVAEKESLETKPEKTPEKEESVTKDEQKEEISDESDKKKDVIEKSETEVKEKDDFEEKKAKEQKEVVKEETDKLEELKRELPDVPKEEIIIEKVEEPTEKQKLKEDICVIQKVDEKLQQLKEKTTEIVDIGVKTAVSEQTEEIIKPKKEEIALKEDIVTIEKIGEKLQKLKEEIEEEEMKAVSEIVTHKVEEPQHAEPVVITTDSLPESPGIEEIRIEDKLDLGRKSPKEREEDVIKIVASVAEVLKSDAPLEEFEGKIPFNVPYKSYTTELRETHITTVESPVTDENKTIEKAICPKASSTYFIEEERKIAPIHEEPEIAETRVSKMIKDSNELMQATTRMIQDIKLSQPKTDTILEEPIKEEQDADGDADGDAGTVHRMLVTASSEDGGEEIEICPPGTITFSRSSESSGRSSPDLQSQKLSQKSSIADTCSDATVITKGADLKDKVADDSPKDVKEDAKDTKDAVIDKPVCDTKKVVTNEAVDKVDQISDDKETTKVEIVDEISVVVSKEQDKTGLDKDVDVRELVEDVSKPDLTPASKKEDDKSIDDKEEKKSDEKIVEEAAAEMSEVVVEKDKSEKQVETAASESATIKDAIVVAPKEQHKEVLKDEKVDIESKTQTEEVKELVKQEFESVKEVTEEVKSKHDTKILDDKNKEITEGDVKSEDVTTVVEDTKIVDDVKKEVTEGEVKSKVVTTVVEDTKIVDDVKKEVTEGDVKSEDVTTVVKDSKTVDVKEVTEGEVKSEDVTTGVEETKIVDDVKKEVTEEEVKSKDVITTGVEDIKIVDDVQKEVTEEEVEPKDVTIVLNDSKIIEDAQKIEESIKSQHISKDGFVTEEEHHIEKVVEDDQQRDISGTKSSEITKEVGEKSSFFGGLVNDIGTSLLHDTSKIIEEAQKQVQDIKDGTKSKSEQMKDDVTAKKEEVVKDISSLTDGIAEIVETSKVEAREVEETVKTEADKLAAKVEEAAEASKSEAGKIVTKETDMALDTAKEVLEATKTMVDEVKESVTEDKENLLETIKELETSVVKDTEAAAEQAKSGVKSAQETLEKEVEDAKEIITEQKQTVVEKIADIKRTVSKDVEAKIEEVKKEVVETQEEAKTQVEHVSDYLVETKDEKVSDLQKAVDDGLDKTKEVIDSSQEKIEVVSEHATAEIKGVLEDINVKEESTKEAIVAETKKAADKLEEVKEEVAESSSRNGTEAETKLKDTVDSTLTEISSVKKDVAEVEHKYDLFNGLETVEKLVVDVLTADRKEVLPKPESPKSTDHKHDKTKTETDEDLAQKQFVKEYVEETREGISAFFKRDSKKEEDLTKSAHDIEQESEIVSDMTKSVVFEKCEKQDHEEQEKRLERAAESIEKEFEAITDMAQSIVFDTCEKRLTEEQKEERVLEKSAKDIEENYEVVSDMAQSMVFETCEKPSTEIEKKEKVLEQSAKGIEENYKIVSDMAQSMVFDTVKEKHEDILDESRTIASSHADQKEVAEKDILKDKVETTTSAIVEPVKDEKSKESPAKSSGKSSPQKVETEDVAAKLSGKSSPALPSDLLKEVSGQSTPDIKDLVKEASGKSTPDIKEIDHIKVDNQDSLLSGKSSPGLSGKSSPALSGRSTPGAKAESKDSLLSGKSTPEHTKPDSKASSLSGKSSPGLSNELKAEEKEKTEKLSVEVREGSAKSSPAGSGNVSPALTTEMKNGEVDKSGKSTPEVSLDKVDTIIGGKVSPPPSLDKVSEKVSSGKTSPESVVECKLEKKEIMSKETKEKCDDKSDVPPSEDVKSDVGNGELQETAKAAEATSAVSEKKTEAEEDKTEKLSKVSLEIQNATEKKLSISDVQVTVKDPAEDKSLSKLESPEDTKHDDKTETKDVDSIDSGIDTEVDSKAKKSDESEKSTEQVTKSQASPTKTAEVKEVSIAGTSASLPEPASTEDLHLSGKSTPDIAEVEKLKEMEETLKLEKHIPGSSTPPTVPVSPIVKEISSIQSEDLKPTSGPLKSVKDSDIRSCTPGSDDYEIGASTHSDTSSGQASRAPHLLESERIESDDEDDVPGSPMSVTSQVAHSRSSSRYDFEDDRIGTRLDPMNTSFYGALPDEEDTELDFDKALAEHRQTRGQDLVTAAEESPSYLYEVTKAKFSAKTPEPETLTGQTQLDQINKNGAGDVMTASFMGELPASTTSSEAKKDVLESWGKPLGLPSPAPPTDNRGTPKKERKLPSNVSAKNKLNDDKKRAESPSKYKNKKFNPVYVDLTYVPHHGNSYYSYVDFFKRVRARYYVFSGIEPSREVYNALLEAKQTWDDKELEVTIIPTYDTDILGYWVAENEELLTKYKIDLSPSASRCTINLQDHETSCSAYRLEF